MTSRTFALAAALVLAPVFTVHAQDVNPKLQTCVACHGAEGISINPQWPNLAGQHPSYLYQQLMAFKMGTRKNVNMNAMVTNLTEDDMRDLAEYYANKTGQSASASLEEVEAGQGLYRGGDATAGIPACMACHGPSGSGNPAANYPKLRGQHSVYTASTLKAYKSGERVSSVKGSMNSIAARMSDQQIEDVAKYLQSLY